jgi:hypothetical protein
MTGSSPARRLRHRLAGVTDPFPTVRRFAASEWRIYRALRLQALHDAPDAFGSTLALAHPMTIRAGARRNGPLPFSAIAAFALAVTGCAKGGERAAQRPDSVTSRVATPAIPVARDSSAVPAAPTTPAPAAPAPATPTYTVTEHGIGPLRAGMTFTEADAVLGGALRVPVGIDTTGCDYLVWSGGPPGVQVMFDEHRIARIDVDTASIATAAGARVGDDEARIKRLYPGQVTVTPHKYRDGHYLTVTPSASADKRFRLVFETAGGRVTRYRAGMMPSVEYVESCS